MSWQGTHAGPGTEPVESRVPVSAVPFRSRLAPGAMGSMAADDDDDDEERAQGEGLRGREVFLQEEELQ